MKYLTHQYHQTPCI